MNTHRHKPEGAQRASDDRLVRLTALLAICVAVIMVAMKGFAWFVTGSVALLGAFLDAIMDLSLSVMNFFVIRHAQTLLTANIVSGMARPKRWRHWRRRRSCRCWPLI